MILYFARKCLPLTHKYGRWYYSQTRSTGIAVEFRKCKCCNHEQRRRLR